MSESQLRGFLFEDEIIRCVTGMSKVEYDSKKKNGYGSAMDIEKGDHSDLNYSIKTSKDGKTVMCGDISRFMHHCKTTDFTMLIGCWSQVDNDLKVYDRILEFNFNPGMYSKVWGNIQPEDVEPLIKYVRSIPHGKESPLSRAIRESMKENITATKGSSLASINPKVDSKTQRRVQCSIVIDGLLASGIPHREHRSNTFKGMNLPYEQKSKARERKVKAIGSVLHGSGVCNSVPGEDMETF